MYYCLLMSSGNVAESVMFSNKELTQKWLDQVLSKNLPQMYITIHKLKNDEDVLAFIEKSKNYDFD